VQCTLDLAALLWLSGYILLANLRRGGEMAYPCGMEWLVGEAWERERGG
jgi:hypothetical protein